jgi:hypothetical protein
MINITCKKTYTYLIDGIDSISYELKELIVKFLMQNTSPKDEISAEIESLGKKNIIIVTSNVEFPYMKMYKLQEKIPQMIEELNNKDKKKKAEDKEYVMGLKLIKMARNVYKSERLNEYVDSVNNVYDNFLDCKREKNWEMARCYADDYKDLLNILTLIEKSEYKEAYHEYRSMDTAVREWVPSSVVQMLQTKSGM